MALLERLAAPFKEFGFVAGALYLIDRLMRAVSPQLGLQVFEFTVQPITDKPLLPSRMAAGFEFREIGPADPEIAQMPARADIKAARYAQGAKCLGAFRKGELIGYLWFCHDHYEEDLVRCDYRLEPPGRSVFDFDLFILPQHRMGLGFVGVWHGANQYLRERGIVHTYSRITRFNLASRRAHAHLGCRCIGRALFVQAWRAELMFASVAPFVAVGVSSRHRVGLTLRDAAFGDRQRAVAKSEDVKA